MTTTVWVVFGDHEIRKYRGVGDTGREARSQALRVTGFCDRVEDVLAILAVAPTADMLAEIWSGERDEE